MTSHVRIGDNRAFTLKQAVLLYQDGSTTFATLHEVKSLHEGAPYLGAGQSVTTGFWRGWQEGWERVWHRRCCRPTYCQGRRS